MLTYLNKLKKSVNWPSLAYTRCINVFILIKYVYREKIFFRKLQLNRGETVIFYKLVFSCNANIIKNHKRNLLLMRVEPINRTQLLRIPVNSPRNAPCDTTLIHESTFFFAVADIKINVMSVRVYNV